MDSKAFSLLRKWRRRKMPLSKRKIEQVEQLLRGELSCQEEGDVSVTSSPLTWLTAKSELLAWIHEELVEDKDGRAPDAAREERLRMLGAAEVRLCALGKDVQASSSFGTPQAVLDYGTFIETALREIAKRQLHENPLEYILKRSSEMVPKGLWLEFGVYSGKSITKMCACVPSGERVYGFDCFEGLPDDWRNGFDKGHFNLNGELPAVPSNCVLIPGYFEETLCPFLSQVREATRGDDGNVREADTNERLFFPKGLETDKIALLHIDCDIYSATKVIFASVVPHLKVGTVIVFDELVGYKGFENHEMRAFFEAVTQWNLKFEWIGTKHASTQSVAIRML